MSDTKNSTNADWIARGEQVFLGNVRPTPRVFHKGCGVVLIDVEGKEYLDFCAGIAVISVGHCHPRLSKAIGDQAKKLMHVSNLFYSDKAIEFAEKLAEATGFERVFFCNSGAEANEALIKLARRYHYENEDTERVELIAAEGSFHGRTYGALSITGQPKYHVGMKPMVGQVRHVPFQDADALKKAVSNKTAAVILEPVQGEGGVITASTEYLQAARKICDDAGALLFFDEVQTGIGRTGKFLAWQWSGVKPDACALAKGIGGGFPLGAIVVQESLVNALPPGSHANTYGGNPLACAAGAEVLSIIEDEKLVENAFRVGEYLASKLKELVARKLTPTLVGARGRGLLQALVFSPEQDVRALMLALQEQGLLLSVAGPQALRFSPPLCVSKQEVDRCIGIVEAALSAL